MIRIECAYCGSEFTAERTTAKYCSDSCKTLAYRRRLYLIDLENQKTLQKIQSDIKRQQDERLKEIQDEKQASETAEQNKKEEEARQQKAEQKHIEAAEKRAKELAKIIEKSKQAATIKLGGVIALLAGGYIVYESYKSFKSSPPSNIAPEPNPEDEKPP